MVRWNIEKLAAQMQREVTELLRSFNVQTIQKLILNMCIAKSSIVIVMICFGFELYSRSSFFVLWKQSFPLNLLGSFRRSVMLLVSTSLPVPSAVNIKRSSTISFATLSWIDSVCSSKCKKLPHEPEANSIEYSRTSYSFSYACKLIAVFIGLRVSSLASQATI